VETPSSKKTRLRSELLALAERAGEPTVSFLAAAAPVTARSEEALSVARRLVGALPSGRLEVSETRVQRLAEKLDRLVDADRRGTEVKVAANGR
jgi:hypothetical protein